MTATKEKPVSEKASKPTDQEILGLLYTQVVKPNDVIKEVVVNIYENKYRINIWTEVYHAFIPNAGKISQSYFCVFDKKGLTIIQS
jgi:hypothetical protein